jgi:hypothetical protein
VVQELGAGQGRLAFEELRQAGVTFIRTGPSDPQKWTDDYLTTELTYQDAAAKAGLRTMPWLRELSHFKPDQLDKQKRLQEIITKLKDRPGLGVWKGADEPEWGKIAPEDCRNVYDLIRKTDPNHPVWIVQAPRGTVDSLKPYISVYDIGGTDIYPISYPPGTHSLFANKEISMVGDYAQRMRDVHGGQKPFWMTLQIAWSGVSKPGKTLRMPTFAQERFMTYQAIINGASGLVYFGGHVPQAWNDRDAKLQWNWTFWERVLKPLIDEVGENSPLANALAARDSKIRIDVTDASGIELALKETSDAFYLLVCKREGETVQARFSGLPRDLTTADVLFESPRRITLANGQFTDWFAPFDVHVYRFSKRNGDENR